MHYVVLFSLPILFLFLNRWRGSRMDELIGFDPPVLHNGAPIAGVGMLGVTFLLTFDIVAALVIGVAYMIGEAPGWAKWIRAVPYWGDQSWQATYNKTEMPRETGKTTGIHWLATRFVRESENFERYTQICLVLRGILWWAPVYAAMAYFGLVGVVAAVIAVLAMGLLFPIAYWIGWTMSRELYIDRAERLYGFAQGCVLAISMVP